MSGLQNLRKKMRMLASYDVLPKVHQQRGVSYVLWGLTQAWWYCGLGQWYNQG